MKFFYKENIKILESFQNNLEDIKKRLTCNEAIRISSISDTEGDRHNSTSVKIILLQNDKKIVYKPRSIATDCAVYSVAEYIFSKLGETVYFPWIIDCGDYCWQEFIEEDLLENKRSVLEFYNKSGVYLSIFLLFGTCDLHYENIYVKDNSPVFVDLEVLGTGEAMESFSEHTFNIPQTSVLSTYLLPIPAKKEIIQFNASGLFPNTKNARPISINKFELNEVNEWKYIQQNLNLSRIALNLSYRGNRISPEFVEDGLIDGFSSGLRVILENKVTIKNLITKLFIKPIKIRQILRPTMVYSAFLEAANHHEYLQSYEKQDKLFNILLENFFPGNKGYYRVQDEIRQLKNGDIPTFYMKSDSKHLFNNDSIVIRDYYLGSYLNFLIERLDSLKENDLSKQIRFIQMALAAYYSPEEFFYENKQRKLFNGTLEGLRKEFISFMDNIVVKKRNDFYSLQLFSLDDFGHDLMFVEGIEASLYNSGGVILSLLELGTSDGFSLGVNLYETLRNKTLPLLKESSSTKVDIGIFSGIGGLLYLSYYLYNLTELDKYRLDFLSLQQYIEKVIIDKLTYCTGDFISGEAGMLTFLSNVYKTDKSIVSERLLNMLYTSMTDNMDNVEDISYSHGKIGECIALLSFFNIVHSEEIKLRIDKTVKYIKTNLQEIIYNNSWCRGITGYYLLLYKLCVEGLDEEGNYQKELKAITIGEVVNLINLNNESLCHGNSGNILIFNKISKMLNKETREYCNKYLKTAVAAPFSTRWTRGSKYLFESFMIGLSGNIYTIEMLNKEYYPLLFLLEV